MNQSLKRSNPGNAPGLQGIGNTDHMVQLTVVHGRSGADGRRAWPHVNLDEGFEYFRNRIHRALYCKDNRSIHVPTLPKGGKVIGITARWTDGTSMDRVTALNYLDFVTLWRRQEERGLPGWLEVELGEERHAVQQEWRDRLRPLKS